MLDQVATTRVPSEFIGLARQFRSQVKLVDLVMDRALEVVCDPIRSRLKRHPKLRAEMLPDLSRTYMELTPTQFRIGKVQGTRHKCEFAVVERRACVSWLQDDHWDTEQREVGLAICRFTLSVHGGRLRQRWTPLANVSLEGLGSGYV